MSIASEITRLQTAKADLKTAIEAKGVTVPSATKLGGYADLVGQISTGTPTLVPYAIRPDAELIQTYTYDKYINADEEVTIPAYTTTATSLKATENLSPTITLDYTNYNYYLAVRTLSIPEYSVTSKAAGRMEYHFTSYMYELAEIPANSFITLVDNTTKITSRTIAASAYSMIRALYWSSGTAIKTASTSYGVYQTVQAPSISSAVMTVKSPVLYVRGSTTYFTKTYMNALTDIRYQYVINVYRAPKNNLNIDGWGLEHQALHILDCVNSNTHKLI